MAGEGQRVVADEKTGASLHLVGNLAEETAGDGGHLAAIRADDVFVVVPGALEPRLPVTDLEALELAVLAEVHQGAENR